MLSFIVLHMSSEIKNLGQGVDAVLDKWYDYA